MVWNLPSLSNEQEKALFDFGRDQNVKVEAPHGAGKTSLLLHCIKQKLETTNEKIIAISYNRDLVNNVINKLNQQYPLWKNRVYINTYHGLLSLFFQKPVMNELLFLEALTFLKNNVEQCKRWLFGNFRYLILDEMQDMRPHYNELIGLLHYGIANQPDLVRMFVVGDGWQLLYGYYAINKADVRFLTLAPELYKGPWSSHQLTISYRSTQPMARVLNVLFPGRNIIPKPVSPEIRAQEPRVILLITDIYQRCAEHILPIVKKYHKTKEILILNHSLNERSPAIKIVDHLVANSIPIHVSRSGQLKENECDSFLLQNKVLLKTNCSSKGLECDIDISVISKNIFDPMELKPEDYVQMTRARWLLVLVVHYDNILQSDLQTFASHFQQQDLRIIVDAPSLPQHHKVKKQEEENRTRFQVNDLFSFMDVAHLQQLLQFIYTQPVVTLQQTNQDSSSLDQYFQEMNITFDQGMTYVNVTQIVGNTLILALEYYVRKEIPNAINDIYRKCIGKQDDKSNQIKQNLEQCFRQLKSQSDADFTPNQILDKFSIFAHLATLLDASCGYSEKLGLIEHFHFIEKPIIFQRFTMLITSLVTIMQKHNLQEKDLIWYKEDYGRFKYEDRSISIKVKPTIAIRDYSIVIDLIHSSQISYEDHLRALLATQVGGNVHSCSYVINVGDGQVQTCKFRSLEPMIPLQFIHLAVSCKLLKEPSLSDVDFLHRFSHLK